MTIVQDIITMARNRTDMVNPTSGVVDAFFDDVNELLPYINSSAGEMYDLLVQTYNDYALNSSSITIDGTVGPNFAFLPSDFLLPRGVEVLINSSQPYSVRPFNFQDRNKWGNSLFRGPPGPNNVQYRCQDGYLFIEPIAFAPGTYTLWYTPVFSNFLTVNDPLPAYMANNAWFEYIVLDVCIKMKDKLELDSSAYERKKPPLQERILIMAQSRAQAEGKTVSTIRMEEDMWGFGYYGGGFGNGGA
jgi:hypothetical protein